MRGGESVTNGKNNLPISILICFNLIFAACGIATIGLGVIILRDNGRQLLFRLLSPGSSIVYQIGIGLIGIGAFGVVTSILGCCAAGRKCSLAWYIISVCLVLGSEVAIGVTFLFFHEAFGNGLELSAMVSKIHSSYGIDQSFSQSMDFVQNKFNCCGSEGDIDYERSTWRNSRLGGTDVFVPWTCCPLNESVSDYPAYMNPKPINSTACQYPSDFKRFRHRYKEGCHSPVEEWIRKETFAFLLMAVILIFLQVSALMASICLCQKIK